MARKSVFCIAQKENQAIQIVQQLKAGGFQHDDISVLFPDKEGTKDFAHEQQTKAPEGAVTGAGTGGALGGALGWLAGIGALAIPGIGPFVAAGPLMAALSGAAVGATVGGITGALVGMGIPEFEAKRYEGKIRGGNILISVHTDTARNAEKAKSIFEKSGAADISTAGEATTKNKEKKEPMAERTETKSRLRKTTTTTQEPPITSGRTSSLSAKTTETATTAASAPVSNGATVKTSEPTQEEIAIRAQEIFIRKGRRHGQDLENWLEAEAELKAERRAGTKPRTSR